MPGKVNPVMAEMLNMVCFHVIGADTCVMMASQAGQLELNVMMPVIAHNLLLSLSLLASSLAVFRENWTVHGVKVNMVGPIIIQYFIGKTQKRFSIWRKHVRPVLLYFRNHTYG